MSYRNWQSLPMLVLVLVLALALSAGAQTRTGAWLDEVIFVIEGDFSQAVTRLEIGDIDVFSETMTDAQLFARTSNSPFLTYSQSYGSYTELTFNPYGPEFQDGRLNPFSVPKIREAMNWLIDRDYIVDEIYGGLAVPKFFPITAAFPDYARYAATAKTLELKYAHNPGLAADIIAEEMRNLGAEMRNGVWHYNGEPVEIIVLIRIEDERRQIGDYVASVLEDVGFVANRLYRSNQDASPLWFSADPTLGLMHIYTGGWITTVVDRDQADNFAYFYTDVGLATPLWAAYQNTDEFYELAQRLDRQDFRTIEERGEMFERALELALEDSTRVWIIDQLAFTPRRSGTLVAADMAGAIGGSWLWSSTLRRDGEVGGSMTIAQQGILVEPWNPIAGSNWLFDSMVQRATTELSYAPDPYTGLRYPRRIESADVVVAAGLPVGQTLDWINLEFVDGEIDVPGDAWIDWDPDAQRFITVAEKHPEGLTALRKTVYYYPEDMFETVKWHDGSAISVGDFVYSWIIDHERGKEGTALYDEAFAPTYRSDMTSFRGQRIVSTDPLITEAYSTSYALDAENNLGIAWPQDSFGPMSWHTMAISGLSEANQDTAWSSAKADKLDVEWLNLIGGPSLAILYGHLKQASADNFIPFEGTLGQYISPEEARQRYANLSKWYTDKGHFWIGTGPMYLDAVFPVEQSLVLKRFEDYPDRADRWDIFAAPMFAEVDVEGPARVSQGNAARFDVWVTFDGAAYPSDLISEVTYVVISAAGEVALSGTAEFVDEGLYEIGLTAAETAQLAVGGSQVAAIVVPIPVAKPTFEGVSFVVTP